MIELEAHQLGTILPVQAQPGSRQNGLRGEHNGSLRVSVTQAPEKGKANKALVAVLAKSLGVKKSQVELLSGETSQKKRFLIREITPEELRKRLTAHSDN